MILKTKEVNVVSDYYAEIALTEGYDCIKSLKTGEVCIIGKDDKGEIIYINVG